MIRASRDARPRFLAASIASLVALSSAPERLCAQRALGIDVSDWQNQTSTGLPIDWERVARPVALGGGGKQFAFIRSSRGGTTGTYNEHTTAGTLSHRYDDFAFEYNITNAKANGVLAGPYHFGRADIISYQIGGNTIIHTGTDEANHMLEQAGQYMRPGYLRPVYDLEAGAAQRTTADLTNFALDFANRIYEVKGIYPLVYINSSYANDQVDSRITLMDLWLARWPNQQNPSQIDINGDPPAAAGYPNVYGVWNPIYPEIPDPTPWKFWQYTSNGHVPGIGNGTTDRVDLNVAHGDVEFVKDFLVPALWNVNSNGQWTTAANWNGNPDLPGTDDRVIIDRSSGDYLITLGAGAHSIRSLSSSERFLMDGGSLTVQQYAHFNHSSTFAGGAINSASVLNNAHLTVSGGAVTTAGNVVGSGSVTVTGGSLQAAAVRQPALSVGGSGVIRLLGGSGSPSLVSTVSFSGGGQIDFAGSTAAMVIEYDPPADSPYELIRLMVRSGFNGGTWDGPGIITSLAASEPGWAIGFGESSELPGVPVIFRPADATALLLRATRSGDANLDGEVNLEDFNLLAAHFGTGTKWNEADFNYDGTVNLDDFNLLAAHFGLGASGPDVTPDDWASLASAVPEPAALSIVAAGASLVLRRRSARRYAARTLAVLAPLALAASNAHAVEQDAPVKR